MEAKDTIAKNADISINDSLLTPKERSLVEHVKEHQAEATWKLALEYMMQVNPEKWDKLDAMLEDKKQEGIREVVEWVNTHKLHAGNISIPKRVWQSKLKDWGIEQPQ